MNDRKRMRILAHKLITARTEAGLKQADIENLGVISQSKLSKIENGERTISMLELEDLAKIYNKPIEFFKTL